MSQPEAVLLIRADAGPTIGSGHIMRCIALAQQWTADGGRAVFACAAVPDVLRQRIRAEGFDIDPVDAAAGSQSDAAATVALSQARNAAVVVDGYGFSADYQASLYGAVPTLAVVDDFGQLGSYQADLILDQNLGASELPYRDRPKECRLLLGLPYVMLRREFVDAARTDPAIEEAVRNILVTTGGADIGGLEAKILLALDSCPGPLDITVVVGGSGAAKDRGGDRDPSSRHHVRTIVNANDMSVHMRSADMAIGAAGSTCWELAHLGVPAILGVVADNQSAAAAALERNGAAVVIDGRSATAVEDIRRAVLELIADHSRRADMSREARRLLDGAGARRVANAIRDATARRHP